MAKRKQSNYLLTLILLIMKLFYYLMEPNKYCKLEYVGYTINDCIICIDVDYPNRPALHIPKDKVNFYFNTDKIVLIHGSGNFDKIDTYYSNPNN